MPQADRLVILKNVTDPTITPFGATFNALTMVTVVVTGATGAVYDSGYSVNINDPSTTHPTISTTGGSAVMTVVQPNFGRDEIASIYFEATGGSHNDSQIVVQIRGTNPGFPTSGF